MDCISVRGMRFFGYHGVFPEERKIGQRFIVHLWLQLDLRKAGQTGQISDTVNYGTAYQFVQQVVEGEPLELIETVAERIADSLLQNFPLLEGVIVEVEKPGAPVQGVLDTVSVHIERQRFAMSTKTGSDTN